MYIQYNGNKIEIRKGQILFWNGQRIYAPIQLPDGTLVDKSGMYITIKTFFGINVYYDGEGTDKTADFLYFWRQRAKVAHFKAKGLYFSMIIFKRKC